MQLRPLNFSGSAGHCKVRELVPAHLGSGGVIQKPIGGATDSGNTDVDTNHHVTEKQPLCDQSLFGGPWWFVHDVQVRGVEPEGGGGQAIGDQVDPQKLYGNQSLGQTKSGSQEN